MKIKFTLFLSALLLLSIYSFAQIKFGASAGINISTLNSNKLDLDVKKGLRSKVGLNAGVNTEYTISEKVSFQSGLNYSQMGGEYTELESGDIYSNINNLNYLAIPLIAKINFKNLAVFVGPQISFLMSAKSKNFENGILIHTDDNKYAIKSTEISGLFGLQYTLLEKFVASVNYQLGLSNLEKIPTGTNIKSNAFTISVGYKF